MDLVFTSFEVGYPTNKDIDSDAHFNVNTDPSAPTPVINLPPNTTDLSWDAGCYQLSTIGDFVWNDLNFNGLQDPGEPGVGNITVVLQVSNGSGTFNYSVTKTNATGYYLFSGLPPSVLNGGPYIVEWIINPILYKFTAAFQGSNRAIDSDATQVAPNLGVSETIFLPTATVNLTIDAGLIKLAQTTGTTGTTGINIVCFMSIWKFYFKFQFSCIRKYYNVKQ